MHSYVAPLAILIAAGAAAPMTAQQMNDPVHDLDTRAVNTLRPGTFFINGKPMDSANNPAAVKSLCDPSMTVTQCAEKTAALWAMNQEYTGQTAQLNIPITMNDNPNYHLAANAYMEFTQCQLSKPQYTWQLTSVDCNAPECDDGWQFQSSTTQMTSEGFHIGASISAGINIGVFTASASLTTDFNTMWSNSNTTTLTQSLSYKLQSGDECTPTTIQYNMQCQVQMKLADPGTVNIIYADGNNYGTFTPCVGNPPFDASQTSYQDFCQALKGPVGLTMNILSPSGTDAWAMQGCD